ncbi:MAG: hypothetical protein HQ568_07200, partial [Calditrichaeota bacterium]|nr:hypothetical protein [Calditrichota bacterium]
NARLEFNLRSAIAEKALSDLASGAGINLFASSGIKYSDKEIQEYGKGLFTHVLIEGLKGNADADSLSGDIRISELQKYLLWELPLESKQIRNQEYYPDIFTTGVDFPLIKK